jgi:hypothetical protein
MQLRYFIKLVPLGGIFLLFFNEVVYARFWPTFAMDAIA